MLFSLAICVLYMDIPKHMKKNGMEPEMKKGRESARKGT